MKGEANNEVIIQQRHVSSSSIEPAKNAYDEGAFAGFSYRRHGGQVLVPEECNLLVSIRFDERNTLGKTIIVEEF